MCFFVFSDDFDFAVLRALLLSFPDVLFSVAVVFVLQREPKRSDLMKEERKKERRRRCVE